MGRGHIRYSGDGAEDQGVTLADMLLTALRSNVDLPRAAQVDGHVGTTMSFRELLQQTVRVAEGWRALGLAAPDVVAIVSRNYHEVFPLVLGALCAGLAVNCPIPTATADELQHAFSLTEPKVVVSEACKLAEAMQAAPAATHMVLTGHQGDPGLPAGILTYQDLLRHGSAADPNTYRTAAVADRRAHISFILYSSGTTGAPKAVALSDYCLSAFLLNYKFTSLAGKRDNLTDSVNRRPFEVKLATSPMYWSTGMWILLSSIPSGTTRVFTTVSDTVSVMEVIQKYKVRSWTCAPSSVLAVLHHEARGQYDLSSLEHLALGGAPLSAENHAALERELGCRVMQGYGATEAGMICSYGQPPRGSVGKPQPGVQLRLVDVETQKDITAANTPGEVRIKTPMMFAGYYGNPEATAQAFDEQGFLKTGDLAYEDENGYIFWVDRIKEILRFMNNQISPAEVEAVLLQHPGVREACVLGRPCPSGAGDLPVAVVVRSDKVPVTADELRALVASKLSKHKHLHGGVVFLDKLPKTASGKLARNQLRAALPTLISS